MRATVRDSSETLREFRRIPEKAIPRRVLRDAKGLAIMRVIKGGFVVSGRIGEGIVIARLPGGGWSAPSAIGTGGAGIGPQIGGQVTEFVFVLNTRAAVDAFAHGGNVQFGGALSAVAGPYGRTAEAGVLPLAAVYAYSRSQGLFVGASLEGTILVEQADKNTAYYGRAVRPADILSGRVNAPSGSAKLRVAAAY